MEKINIALMNLRKAIAESDECKNVTSIRLFMNAYETKISATVSTANELRLMGVSMKNIAGDFIVNDYGKPSFPYVFDCHEVEENGPEW